MLALGERGSDGKKVVILYMLVMITLRNYPDPDQWKGVMQSDKSLNLF